MAAMMHTKAAAIGINHASARLSLGVTARIRYDPIIPIPTPTPNTSGRIATIPSALRPQTTAAVTELLSLMVAPFLVDLLISQLVNPHGTDTRPDEELPTIAEPKPANFEVPPPSDRKLPQSGV
jgi:hypothetical protein